MLGPRSDPKDLSISPQQLSMTVDERGMAPYNALLGRKSASFLPAAAWPRRHWPRVALSHHLPIARVNWLLHDPDDIDARHLRIVVLSPRRCMCLPMPPHAPRREARRGQSDVERVSSLRIYALELLGQHDVDRQKGRYDGRWHPNRRIEEDAIKQEWCTCIERRPPQAGSLRATARPASCF